MTENTIERSPFFIQCGGHCCCGDLVGRTTFRFFFFFSGLQKLEFGHCSLFPGRAKDLQHPGKIVNVFIGVGYLVLVPDVYGGYIGIHYFLNYTV